MCFGPCENSEHPTGYLVTSYKEPAVEVTSDQISQNDRKEKKKKKEDMEMGKQEETGTEYFAVNLATSQLKLTISI